MGRSTVQRALLALVAGSALVLPGVSDDQGGGNDQGGDDADDGGDDVGPGDDDGDN